MTALFGILAAVSFVAMMILKRIKPAFFALFVVFLISVGLFIKEMGVFGGSNRETKGLIANEKAFRTARAKVIADFLNQELKDKRVVIVIEPGYENDIFSRTEINALKGAFQGTIEISSPSMPSGEDNAMTYTDYVDGKRLQDHFKTIAGADGYILYSGFPENKLGSFSFINTNKVPFFAVSAGGASEAWIKKQLKSGKIAALFGDNPERQSKAQAVDDYKECFSIRYKTYTKDNAQDFKF